MDSNQPHVCDDQCMCPVHGTPLLYALSRDDHACQDADCVHGHGGLTPGDPARDYLRAKFEHEIKPFAQHIADQLGKAYELPEGMRLEWVAEEPEADRG